MSASHSKKFSSFIGPAMIPSGGFKVNSTTKNLYICNNLHWGFLGRLLIQACTRVKGADGRMESVVEGVGMCGAWSGH